MSHIFRAALFQNCKMLVYMIRLQQVLADQGMLIIHMTGQTMKLYGVWLMLYLNREVRSSAFLLSTPAVKSV